MSILDTIYNLAVSKGSFAQREVPMREHTTMKTGGNAELFVIPNSKELLSEILKICKENDVRYMALGNGSNMIVSDKGIKGLVLKLEDEFSKIEYAGDGKIICGAGASLVKVCNFALEKGLTGLEFAYGIPGTVGGAAYMNAGAYESEMKSVLVSCEHVTDAGKIESFVKDELDLGYRHSVYSDKNYIITEIVLQLKDGDKTQIKSKMTELMQRRKEKQPLEYPSAGSVFKRPEGYFAGALIEGCGLKGKTIGGAQVSEKHAGFIINTGKATTEDILNLIKFVQETVLKEKGIMLETEVRVIGEQ